MPFADPVMVTSYGVITQCAQQFSDTDANGQRTLLVALNYVDPRTGRWYGVPSGYPSNGYSIPKYLRWLFSPFGKGWKAAVLHDYMCDEAINAFEATGDENAYYFERTSADRLFCQAMIDEGVGWPKWWLFYRAVRIGTKGDYRE